MNRYLGLALGLAILPPLVAVAPATAASTTTVSMNVIGCEGCRFIAHDGKTVRHAWRKVAMSAPVVNGQTSITVPRKGTPYTSFEVKHPEGLTENNAVAFVAFRKNPTNNICWGKKQGAQATLYIIVTTNQGRLGNVPVTYISARVADAQPESRAGVNGTPGCPIAYR